MDKCIYCGGAAGINVVERPTGPLHYSRIECAEFLLAERDRLNLQIHDAMEIIQDHCDLLSEQPVDSKRPFIIGARARLAAFIEKYKIKTGPEQYTDKRKEGS